jgi:hypothetical protein
MTAPMGPLDFVSQELLSPSLYNAVNWPVNTNDCGPELAATGAGAGAEVGTAAACFAAAAAACAFFACSKRHISVTKVGKMSPGQQGKQTPSAFAGNGSIPSQRGDLIA